MPASYSTVRTGKPSWVRAQTSSSQPPGLTVQRQQTPLSLKKAFASCSSFVLMNFLYPVLSTSSIYTFSLTTFSFTSNIDLLVHYSLAFRPAILVFFYPYLIIAFFENYMAFSRSIFYCSRGEEATGASLPPFLAAFLSSFQDYQDSYFLLAALRLFLLFYFGIDALQFLFIELNLGLMRLRLFGELRFFALVSVEEFFVAEIPYAIEDCSCQTVNGKDFSGSIAKVYENKHSKYKKYITQLIILSQKSPQELSCLQDQNQIKRQLTQVFFFISELKHHLSSIYLKQYQFLFAFSIILHLFFIIKFLWMLKQNQQNLLENDDDKIIDDGFSSQQQLKPEEIFFQEKKDLTQENNHKQEVRFKIPPPPEIKDKSYSLHPDIETGWSSKVDLPVPIPIIFQSEKVDYIVKKMLKYPHKKVKLCYLGPRYENTYYSWYDKAFKFPYHHIKAPNDMKFTNRPFCGQHWQAEDQLTFDSFYESGNLDCVIKVGQRQYDCFMRVDSNTIGHLQWFNFKVKGWKKLLKYKLNICNFQKDKCLFARGMKPYIYSEKRFLKEKIGWQQDGQNMRFQRKHLAAAKAYEIEMNSMYRLSFQFYTSYDDDEIQIAYCIPYTYTRLSQFLHHISVKPESKSYLKINKLCNSLGGLEVPLLIIHQGLQQSNEDEDEVQKRCVIICGRAHPGESNGSHMMQGFIEWLCGNTKEAVFLRKNIVFKIVPMLNPDGVALGNYRTGLSGKDFNREYKSPDKTIFPEVYYFKKLAVENRSIFNDKLLMFLDFHGHSTKKNTFMYGPQFPIIDRFYYQARIFPKLLGNVTSMFRYYSCIFKINQFKETTARAVLLRKLGIPLSYTIETSNGFFFDYELLKDVPYTMKLWKEMGLKIGQALYEYIDILIMSDKNRIDKAKNRRKDKNGKHKKKNGQKGAVQKNSIFSMIQNQKIKNLFQEIKQAEMNKQKQKISDDEMSEGASDGQGEQNDLSPKQGNYLVHLIKNGNCKTISRCRMKTKHRFQQRKTTEDKQQQLKEENIQPIEQPQLIHQFFQSQEVFNRKKVINIRKPVSSKQKLNQPIFQEADKKGTAAKIINFSLFTNPPRMKNKNFVENTRFNMPSKLNFIDLVTGKWTEQKSKGRRLSQGKAVMDLSDPYFRKTFSIARQKKQEFQRLNELSGQYISSKRTRFDHLKYKRLLLSNNQFKDQ